MERLTKRLSNGNASWNYPIICFGEDDSKNKVFKSVHRQKACEKLAAYEETGLEPEAVEHLKLASMGKAIAEIKEFEGVPVDRLRELAQAYRLLGNTVYEPNKRGVISTYKVISVHFSGCSILVGWDLLDGIYSNLNGFEISALGKTVFLTREAAEAALEEKEAEHDR